MIRTRISDMFGLQYPIMSAPMALHSGGTLAAAVSKAGGLGTFGGIQPFAGVEWVRKQIAYVRGQTDRPFGVGYITAFIPMFPDQFEAAIDAKVPVICLSFGSPQPWLEKAKASGSKVICQVQMIDHARQAVSGGADVIVVQGNEAGGHTGEITLLPLLARVIEEFPDVPVMAAGGIGNGRTLAAVLTAGADGAWLGTAFLATPECVEIPDRYKELVIESDGEDTVFTRIFDIMSGLPWPQEIGVRVRRNAIVDEWEGRERELRSRKGEFSERYMTARRNFDIDNIDVALGQSAGFVRGIRPAAEIVHTICDEAERILAERPRTLLSL
jgi:nitronate monooxygenase